MSMNQLAYSLHSASSAMAEAALPMSCTPPRAVRVARFEAAQSELAGLCVETIFGINKKSEPDFNCFVPLGIYATREALSSLVQTDDVDHSKSSEVSEELQTVCDFLKNKIHLTANNGNTLGYAAELGITNMIWAGISEGQLGLKYGILLGKSGLEIDHYGLKKDVDLAARTQAGCKQPRKKIQVKASRKRAKQIYDDNIDVVTAQDIVNTSSPEEAVAKLLKWDRVNSDVKTQSYRRLSTVLGIRFSS